MTFTDELGTYKDPGVAAYFNKFFSTIGNKLSQCFSNQPLPSNNPYNNISPTFNFKPITHDFTSKQILSLNTKKAIDQDNINLRILWDAAPAVVGPLSTIINTSLKIGIILEEWKEASCSITKRWVHM